MKPAVLFYPISDVTQVKLHLDFFFGTVKGSVSHPLLMLEGVEVPMQLTAQSFFRDGDTSQAGVLFWAGGELYLLFTYNHQHTVTSVFVLSRGKMGLDGKGMSNLIPTICTIKEALALVEKGVVNAFFKRTEHLAWSELNA